MDCKTARLLLDFARPLTPELDEGETEALQSHLADCPECGGVAQAERTADFHLGKAVRDVPVPADFRERLLARLDRELSAHNRRRWLRRLGVAAAAACVLVGIWLGVRWSNRPIPLDIEQASDRMPIPDLTNLCAGDMQDFFRSQGAEVVAPRFFNYQLLAFYGFDDLQGKRTPVLLFIKGRNQARVYILSDTQFDLHQAVTMPFRTGGSGRKWVVRPCRRDNHFAYAILYTGDSLEAFLAEGKPSAM